MPTYSYQAKRGPTDIVEGTVEAQSQDDVVARLLRDGLVPVTILISAEEVSGQAGRQRRVRVSAKERRLFTRQLTSLLKAKVELVLAVSILNDQSPSKAVHLLLEDLERHMRDGNDFSSALARHPRVFPSLFLAAIRAGEAVGKLDDILIKLVEFDQQQEEFESQLRGAIVYPLLLLFMGLACVGFFVWVVVPRMSMLFDQLGGALPWPTRFLIGLSQWLKHGWPWAVGTSAVSWLIGQRLSRSLAVRAAAERLLRLVGFTREILDARQIGRFARTLQLLLESGLPIFQAMDVARPTLDSVMLESRIREAQERVKGGAAVAESLREVHCFPPLVTHMVAVGESAGTLVDVLNELASYYERSLNETLRLATSLLEPIMIILMGLLVGFCVLAMVLPIFQMTQLVH